MLKKVNIRPGVSVLAVLQHLNYRPWFAISEFVDNAVQSYCDHQENLFDLHGKDFKLRVDVKIDTSSAPRIFIRDNAAGIHESEYPRAFRPAAVPPNQSGLSEFGMGMKSAACWFAPSWIVRTSAIGEPIERTIRFDIENIVNDDIEELEIREISVDPASHYTEIILEDVHHLPVRRTVGKLKDHLTDIYRVFIRNGILELTFNEDSLEFHEPKILESPYFRDKNGETKKWKKPIEFDFGNDLSVHGFAAILETGDTAKAGFSLFRRGRVIQGSGDEKYRPIDICGRSNSYRYQRLYGELHLEGFDVSHTKDGFRWDENEIPFLELLKEHLDSEGLPLLKQAEGYRARPPRQQIKEQAEIAVNKTVNAIIENLPEIIPTIINSSPIETSTHINAPKNTLAGRQFDIEFQAQKWSVNLQFTNDPSINEWLELSVNNKFKRNLQQVDIRLSMAHPFMVRFAKSESEDLEVLLRIAAAIAVAEELARQSGVRSAGTIRRNINNILREALSEP